MYCPTKWHNDTDQPHSLETLKTAWKSIYQKSQHLGLPYKISFTGGEVTANKSFLPLIEYLRSGDFNIGQLIVTTNGSASQNYYLKLARLVDAISFSTHSEFIDEARFFSNVLRVDGLMIKPKKSVHVNIMEEYWNESRIKLYTKWLTDHNISHSVNTIDYSKQIRLSPIMKGVYNLEQI
jgi:organic radical activating enzyme